MQVARTCNQFRMQPADVILCVNFRRILFMSKLIPMCFIQCIQIIWDIRLGLWGENFPV
jgi:hypothetical protein